LCYNAQINRALSEARKMPKTTKDSKPLEESDTRLNLKFKVTEVKTRIERVRRLGNHGTATEAIARALHIYAALLEETREGAKLYTRDKEGNLSRLIL
jgi:hypothetical protein